MNETKREYLKRINFILDFIENNLDSNLSLDFLSKKAHYSPYHFHRVFLIVVNERLNEFVQRKRIERIASIILVDSEVSLNELLYKYGFNSDSSFSRAFKKYYGVNPTKFKTEGKQILRKIGIETFSSEKYICSITNIKDWIKMNAQIRIKEFPEIQLASISKIGKFEEIGNMFQKLMKWGNEKRVLDFSNFKAITVYHDNPNVTEKSKVRFSAGVTINQNIDSEGEIRQIILKKGVYAVGHFEIKGEEISKAWKNMCIWVIEKGYEFRDGDFFEIYHNDSKTHPEKKFILDICIPLYKMKNSKEKKRLSFSSSEITNKSDPKSLDYYRLISYMKELRIFFNKEYETIFKLGKIYKESPDYSYFSLTTAELKNQKLKYVIVLNHKTLCFSICLSGQNKEVRKKYWRIFKESDWGKYHLAETIDNSLEIISHVMVEEPNFDKAKYLTQKIEEEAIKFIKELEKILG
ncbi:AraC family transcriptional regulator [Tenacibaculum aiptasiae]|uniref:AraC family transcriptional regulator n=1 Tax=Tenacibaculum aiptasiae TaxID=426481 RepID=A0A7J5AQA0_9FLAO|nr:AraC family transcriptional regulator [Tenacibaculum aiptasiae]KAB1159760.1 AraC family transcriptional regulator [Tenacibaculum aiptasiae]